MLKYRFPIGKEGVFVNWLGLSYYIKDNALTFITRVYVDVFPVGRLPGGLICPFKGTVMVVVPGHTKPGAGESERKASGLGSTEPPADAAPSADVIGP